MSFLTSFRTALALAEVAEAAVPISGKGKDKLDFVIGAASAIFETEEEVRVGWKDPATFAASVGKAATLIVALKNAAGVFKRI